MKNIINILMAAGAVVLVGIIVVLLFLTGVLPPGQKGGVTLSDPDPVQSTTPSPSRTPQTSTPEAPSPALTPSPPPAPAGMAIPGGGGELRINNQSEVQFTPDRGGVWVLRTFDSSGDPYLELKDQSGREIAYDDDGAGDLDSLIAIELDGGAEYTIIAGFYGDGAQGGYTLSAQPAMVIPGAGGSVLVQGTTGYSFTPNESGPWEMRTYDNEDDPYLMLLDVRGGYITSDDDGGEGYNAHIAQHLDAGTTYCIIARNYDGSNGSFTLTVSPWEDTDDTTLHDESVMSMRVDAPFAMPFIPHEDGIWVIYTSNNGDADPMLELYDAYGNLIADDDDGWSGDGLNAILTVFVYAGEEYTINCVVWGDTTGSYTLNIKSPVHIAAGDSINAINTSGFIFTPGRSGTYEFRTSNNGDDDPCLDIFDDEGDYIDSDDDGGDGLNSLLSVELNAGETYHLFLSFYGVAHGTCTVSVAG